MSDSQEHAYSSKYRRKSSQKRKQKWVVRGEGPQPEEKRAEQAKGGELLRNWGHQHPRMLQKDKAGKKSVTFRKLFVALWTVRVVARFQVIYG